MSAQPLEDLVARLERERQEADRLYNDALTEVDRAIQGRSDLPDPPAPYDDHQITPINAAWDILPAGPPPVDRSLKGRLRAFVWRLVGPPLDRQRQFNAALVDHLNRNVAAHLQAQQAVGALIREARHQFDALVRFESVLVQYLQTITLYIDSKDRRVGGDELWERLMRTEQRFLALKREVEGMLSGPASPLGPASDEARTAASQEHTAPAEAFSARVDSLTYVGFEDRFRGSQDEIRGRLDDYMAILASSSDVLDIGCGRGELLDLLKERGVTARGVDTNHAMVEVCRARGLQAEHADALGYLERQQDNSLGGLVAIQVVEHLEPGYLQRMLETAYHKLRAGAPLILETINPACWMAFFETYIRDLTHQRPLHPDTLRYLVQASGFTKVDVQYRAPVRDIDRLERVPRGAADAPEAVRVAMADMVATINAHADKLNARLFSSMDYAIVARR